MNETVAHNLSLAAELLRLETAFRDAGLALVAWKGPVQAQLLHGAFVHRRFHDLDLLLAPAQLARAEAVLRSLGYASDLHLSPAQRRSFLRHHHEQAYVRAPNYVVELHWQMAQRQFAIDYDVRDIIERARHVSFQGREVLSPGPDDTLVLCAVHAAKHAWAYTDLLDDLGRAAGQVRDWKQAWQLAAAAHVQRYVSCGLLLAEQLGYSELPPEAKRVAGRDRAAVELAHGLFQRRNGDTITPLSGSVVRGRERWRDRARMVVRTAFTPTLNDWSARRFSDRWFYLYYLTRQERLLRNALSSVARTS